MGPLNGIKVLELAGQGPGPFAAMLLADMGADVLRLDRADQVVPVEEYERRPDDVLNRGRRSVGIDLKNPEGAAALLRLVGEADALMEGFRPGVMERLGVGPAECLARNPRLVYGRMTGWGQSGPLARVAGHDINYAALSGILHAIGEAGGPPTPALNLLGDFGGGGMLLALGIACGLIEAMRSGEGQVVDAAMFEGAAQLGTMQFGMRERGEWSEERGTNLLDGGAPFFAVYETADGRWVAVGAMEPQFYAALVETLGLAGEELPEQMDRAGWPRLKERFAAVFRAATRDEWCERFAGVEACFAPVLGLDEAHEHEQARARGSFVELAGVPQPAPAPRFSRTESALALPPPAPGEHSGEALRDWGFSAAEVEALEAGGAVSSAARPAP